MYGSLYFSKQPQQPSCWCRSWWRKQKEEMAEKERRKEEAGKAEAPQLQVIS